MSLHLQLKNVFRVSELKLKSFELELTQDDIDNAISTGSGGACFGCAIAIALLRKGYFLPYIHYAVIRFKDTEEKLNPTEPTDRFDVNHREYSCSDDLYKWQVGLTNEVAKPITIVFNGRKMTARIKE